METQQPTTIKLDGKKDNRELLNESYLEMNKLRIKEKEEKTELEFARYKQDCRKKALDIAERCVTSSAGGEIAETIIKEADKYYNWLISIPEK